MSEGLDEISLKHGRHFVVHEVKKGETLSKLAKKYGTTIDSIMKHNPIIKDKNLIVTGWKLEIPNDSATGQKYFMYTVVHGDNLTKIAAKFKTTIKAIVELNPKIEDPNLIITGWVLKVPDNR